MVMLPTALFLLSAVMVLAGNGHLVLAGSNHLLPSQQGGSRQSDPKVKDFAMNPDRHPRSVQTQSSTTLRVFDFSTDNDGKADKDGEYTSASLNAGPLPDSFTICSTYMVEAWPTKVEGRMFQILSKEGQGKTWGRVNVRVASNFTEYGVTLGPVKFAKNIPSVLFPLQWTHACLSLDGDHTKKSDKTIFNYKVKLVVDMQLLGEEEYKGKDWSRPEDLSLLLGYGSGQEFTGKVTELNIYSPALSKKKMKNQTTAGGEECGAPGNLVSWEEAEWTMHSQAKVVEVDREWEGPCRREAQVQVFTADFKKHIDCMQHCQKISAGISPPVITRKEWEILMREINMITPDRSKLPTMWLSATEGDKGNQLATLDHWPETEIVDEEALKLRAEETIWRDFYTGQRLQPYNLTTLQPYINQDKKDREYGSNYNCMQVLTNYDWDECWLEWKCVSGGNSCPCSYQSQPLLRMRGLCQTSLIDTLFTTKQLPTNPTNMMLIGLRSTKIEYNDTRKRWALSDLSSNVSAVIQSKEHSYLLGKHNWTISNDDIECNEGKPYTAILKLTGCNPNGEFTCDNGQCVKMEERCNQVPNCKDKSDEKGCHIMALEEGYNKNIPPIQEARDGSAIPAMVNISITLMKVVEIEETAHSIKLQFEIRLMWRENRVKYQNLKKKTSLNALTEHDYRQLWLPLVIYDNTDQKDSTRLGDPNGWEWSTLVFVVREGNFTKSGLEDVDETEIFEGSENILRMIQTYTREFQCKYLLQKYPFDTQVPFLINFLRTF